ncbi:hypothetical protein OB03_00285 [Brevundimonas sp. GN22]
MSDRVGRREAARLLMSRRQFAESAMVVRPQGLRNSILAGFQAALTVAIALPLVQLSPWSALLGYASLGALVALFGRFAPKARRNVIVVYAALCQVSSLAIMSIASLAGVPTAGLLLVLALLGGLYFIASTVGRFGPPGPLIFMFSGMAGMNAPASLQDLGVRVLMASAVATLAIVVCAVTEALRAKEDVAEPRQRYSLRQQLQPLWPTAGRIAGGALIAGWIAHAVGVAHPGWAAMGAVAVLQGVHLHVTLNRALQRVAGTVIGAVLIWIILSQSPSVWAGIALLFLLQWMTEAAIGYNYALGQMFVTPMALLMTYLASPATAGAEMAPERVLDTLLGAVIAVVLAVIFSTGHDRRELAKRHVRISA